jgi:hypothetical protein
MLVMSSSTTSRSSSSPSASRTVGVPAGCDDRVAGGERRLGDVDAHTAASTGYEHMNHVCFPLISSAAFRCRMVGGTGSSYRSIIRWLASEYLSP